PQPLADAVAAVFNAALSFFMSHFLKLRVGRLLPLFFAWCFLRSNTDQIDLYPSQLSTVSDRAMITFAPFELERDDFFVFALFDDFGGDLGARDKRVSVCEIFPVGIHQDIAKRRCLPRLNVK